ncbi:hypothetical protein SAMN06265337_1504 [Hymenobacter gelipurpurascens]|uniref:Uncharacterized protein n=1 Tax=Hymenobacter gelipurpurascens TaxID=89968 RepID=A0A212TJ90_9BACT|nr:hypothetical protein [Hymenobacter gelipurpurascens]SNC66118.1 hypothetical protein SAMN06265337_1504 [Hymenobacter gelipurpurascens]
MLSVFLVIGLGLVLAAVYYLVGGSTRPPSSNASTPAPVEATDQLVLVVGPPVAEVIQVSTEFREFYQDGDLVAYPFQIHAVEPGITALTFPLDLPAEIFYYLVNYLTYPESGYSVAAQVHGWATLPIITRNKVVAAPEPVLVCVPPQDTQYDVVLLVTPASAVYQVSVGSLLPTARRCAVPLAYAAPPYPLTEVRQLSAIKLS